MSVLDDEQIESLMMETGEYVTFLAQHSDFNNAADPKSLPLPAKLSYLQVIYVYFTQIYLHVHTQTYRNEGIVKLSAGHSL